MRRNRAMLVAVLGTVALVIAVATVAMLRADHAADHRDLTWVSPPPTAEQVTPSPALTLTGRAVDLPTDGYVSWALAVADKLTYEQTNTPGQSSNTAESTAKAWIAADWLRLHDESTDARIDEITRMIRDSDNDAAQRVYLDSGGDATMQRMTTVCGLEGTIVVPGRWAATDIPVADLARLGICIAQGRAAGDRTGWLLEEMRNVRGEGRFGIPDGLPGGFDANPDVAIKNGWTLYPDGWHVNCLAIADTWVLAVEQRYPADRGIAYGADVCASITQQLVTT